MKSSGSLFAVFFLDGYSLSLPSRWSCQLSALFGAGQSRRALLPAEWTNVSRHSPLNCVFSPFLLQWLLNSAAVSLSKTLNHANTWNEFVPGVELRCSTCDAIFAFPYPLVSADSTPSRGHSHIAVFTEFFHLSLSVTLVPYAVPTGRVFVPAHLPFLV